MVEDDIAQMARSLRNIEQYLGIKGLSDDSEETTQPRYFSTGPGGITVSETEFDFIKFGLVAKTVNVRFSDDIDMAFLDPNRKSAGIIPLTTDRDGKKFTIGGDNGIEASRLWLRKADTATTDPVVHIIAFN